MNGLSPVKSSLCEQSESNIPMSDINGSILDSDRFKKARDIVHHHKTNIAGHSEKTAEYGKRICQWLKKHDIEVSEEDVVTACLLHDIGMTDDEVSSTVSWKKAYLHPRRGEEIARHEYDANEIQCNAIRRHMWPICIVPPRTREGWIVVAADKCCSIWEVTHNKKKKKENL